MFRRFRPHDRTKRALLLSSTAGLLFVGAAAAHAQSVTEAPPAEQEAAQTTPVDRDSELPEDSSGDVIVTAQRREQRLLDVPISIAAVGGELIEERGLNSPAELFQQVPNVGAQFTSNTDGLPIFNIRGVTLLDFSETNESSVATYVDEVYIGSPAVQNGQLFDLERLEVLRGPQGTLWGRNATGGVISWVTRKPTRDFEGRLFASIGSWGDARVQGILSGPFSESLRGRLAVQLNSRGDTTDNLFEGGRDEFGSISQNTVIRLGLEADVTDTFLLSGNVHYGRYVGQSPPRGYFGALDANGQRCSPERIFAGECAGANGFRNPDPNPREAYSELQSAEIDNENWGTWLRGEWDFGSGFSLVSLTSHDEVERIQNIDVDGSPFPVQHVQFFIDHKQTTQELRVAYASAKFDGTVGAYYYHDDRVFTITIPTLASLGSYARREGESYAVFAQGTYAVTPTFNLTGGVRYTDDDIQFPIITLVRGGRPGEDVGTPVYRVAREVQAQRVTWRGAADWHFQPDHMLFGSVSTGYKSGAVNTGLPTSLASVTVTEPETLITYELGAKGSFGPLLRYSLTGFYTDYKNIQVAASISSGTVIVSQLVAIDEAKISGFEAELSSQPFPGLSLDVGLGYLDGRYSADPSLRIGSVPLDGKRPVLMPQFTVSGAIRYEHDLGPGSAYAGLDGRWQDAVFFGPDNLPTERQGAYAVLNARVGYRTADDAWAIEAFVKNLTEREYFVHLIDGPSTVNSTWGQPRTWGLQVTRNFR